MPGINEGAATMISGFLRRPILLVAAEYARTRLVERELKDAAGRARQEVEDVAKLRRGDRRESVRVMTMRTVPEHVPLRGEFIVVARFAIALRVLQQLTKTKPKSKLSQKMTP